MSDDSFERELAHDAAEDYRQSLEARIAALEREKRGLRKLVRDGHDLVELALNDKMVFPVHAMLTWKRRAAEELK